MGKKRTAAEDEVDEIEEIFKSAKSKTKKTAKVTKSKQNASKSHPKKAKSDSKLKIYTEEELKIGKGGLTDKCPFDCDCCF